MSDLQRVVWLPGIVPGDYGSEVNFYMLPVHCLIIYPVCHQGHNIWLGLEHSYQQAWKSVKKKTGYVTLKVSNPCILFEIIPHQSYAIEIIYDAHIGTLTAALFKVTKIKRRKLMPNNEERRRMGWIN